MSKEKDCCLNCRHGFKRPPENLRRYGNKEASVECLSVVGNGSRYKFPFEVCDKHDRRDGSEWSLSKWLAEQKT